MSPYDLLGAIIGSYGRAEILTRRLQNSSRAEALVDFHGRPEMQVENRQMTKAEVLIELGRIASDTQKLSRANEEFKKAIGGLLQNYGVTINELGLT